MKLTKSKLKEIIREELKLIEQKQLYVVALRNGEVVSGDKAVSGREAFNLLMKLSKQSDGWKMGYMIDVDVWNGTHPKSKGKPHELNKKKIMVGGEKN